MTVQISPRIRTGTAALAGAGILAALGVSLLTLPANAAPGDPTPATGSITVHKLEQPEGNLGANDGSKLDLTGKDVTPLVAGFTACAISDIDLASSAEWDRLGALTVSVDQNGAPVVTEKKDDGSTTVLGLDTCTGEQQTAASDGSTTFAELATDTAYVVYESSAASGAVTASQPTIVTVPYPGTGTDPVWNYHPHIYPKNVIAGSGASKTGKLVGDQIVFDITVPVNPLAEGETYSQFEIADRLAETVKHTGSEVKLFGKGGKEVTLTTGDYTLTTPAAERGGTVDLKFTQSGLAKLDGAIGGRVILTINVDAVSEGTTANRATITINGKSTDGEGGENPGPEVVDPENYFSGARIIKEAKNKGASTTVPLAGAAFDVYAADDNAVECPAKPAANAVRVLKDQKSGDDGRTPSRVLGAGKYCVYETAAPAGYKMAQGGAMLTVAANDASVTVVNTQMGADQGDLPSLPLTGSSLSILVVTAGGVLLVLGILLLLSRRRSSSENR